MRDKQPVHLEWGYWGCMTFMYVDASFPWLSQMSHHLLKWNVIVNYLVVVSALMHLRRSPPLTIHLPILLVTVFSCIPSHIHSYKFLLFLTPCTGYHLWRKITYCHFEPKQGIRSKAAMAAPMQVDEAVPGDSSKLKPYTSSDAC